MRTFFIILAVLATIGSVTRALHSDTIVTVDGISHRDSLEKIESVLGQGKDLRSDKGVVVFNNTQGRIFVASFDTMKELDSLTVEWETGKEPTVEIGDQIQLELDSSKEKILSTLAAYKQITQEQGATSFHQYPSLKLTLLSENDRIVGLALQSLNKD